MICLLSACSVPRAGLYLPPGTPEPWPPSQGRLGRAAVQSRTLYVFVSGVGLGLLPGSGEVSASAPQTSTCRVSAAGIPTPPTWLHAEPALVPEGAVGSPASSVCSLLCTQRNTPSQAGSLPGQEGFVLRPRSLISSCSLPELLSALTWCHCPPLQDELTPLLYPAHFFPRLGP